MGRSACTYLFYNWQLGALKHMQHVSMSLKLKEKKEFTWDRFCARAVATCSTVFAASFWFDGLGMRKFGNFLESNYYSKGLRGKGYLKSIEINFGCSR